MKSAPIEIAREGGFRTVVIINGDEIEIRSQFGSDDRGWEFDIESGITISRAAFDRLVDIVRPKATEKP